MKAICPAVAAFALSFIYIPLICTQVIYGQATPPNAPPMPPEQVQQKPAPAAQPPLSQEQKMLQDWPNLARYRNDDVKAGAPATGEDRVVFMGDSITDGWSLAQFFPGKPYINRGISGQTTPQMLVRFRPDVIALKPKLVVILAGTNDLAGNTGPETLEDIESNLASMAQLAQANGVKVVLSSVMPVCDYIKPQTEHRPPGKIITLNSWIKDFCTRNGFIYLDYYSAMLDEKNMLKKELTRDGLHPNNAGYQTMGPLASKAIETALGKS